MSFESGPGTPSHAALRLAGALALAGSTGIFVGNFFHPFPPMERAAMLDMIAAEPAWSAIHLPTMFFAVALLCALVTLADLFAAGGYAPALARAGRVAAQVGVPVMLVGVAIDGFGFKVLADAYAAAPADQRAYLLAAADAVVQAEAALLHVWVTMFLGVSFLLFGVAMALDRAWPRGLAWLGVIGGAGCLFSGIAGFLRWPVAPPFPLFGTLVLAWSFALGILLLRGRGGSLRA